MSRPDNQTERGAALAASAGAGNRGESRSTRGGSAPERGPTTVDGRSRRRRLGALVVLAALAGACAPADAGAPSPAPPRWITFQNTTIEPLSLYLVGGGGEWLLGHVDANRAVRLRLPPGFPEANVGLYSLVAVPLALRDPLARDQLSNPAAIISMAVPAQHLAEVRWMLVARQLVSAVPADVASPGVRVR